MSKFSVILPKHAIIKHVDFQNDDLCMWAIVDENEEDQEERFFEMYGTGHDINTPIMQLNHLKTFLSKGGMFVFHLFENEIKRKVIHKEIETLN